MPTSIWYLLVAAIASASAVLFVLVAERVGRAAGLVDRPRRGELQEYILPRTGGYGVLAACWLAILFGFVAAPEAVDRLPADVTRLVGILLGSLLLIPLAVIDDARRLP